MSELVEKTLSQFQWEVTTVQFGLCWDYDSLRYSSKEEGIEASKEIIRNLVRRSPELIDFRTREMVTFLVGDRIYRLFGFYPQKGCGDST